MISFFLISENKGVALFLMFVEYVFSPVNLGHLHSLFYFSPFSFVFCCLPNSSRSAFHILFFFSFFFSSHKLTEIHLLDF